MFFLEADHMHDSLYLHAPPIEKMNNISWMDLTLSYKCSYILHGGVHILEIFNTMVHYSNLMGFAPQIGDHFESWGRYL